MGQDSGGEGQKEVHWVVRGGDYILSNCEVVRDRTNPQRI